MRNRSPSGRRIPALRREARLLLALSWSAVALLTGAAASLEAQESPPGALAGLGSPPDPKVAVSWDRYYDHAAVEDIGRRLEEAYPDRCRLGSIGKSCGWCSTP